MNTQSREGHGVSLILVSWFITISAMGQGTLFSIFTNGLAANRINIVVLAEGYTNGQTNLFLTHATNAVNNLLAQSPYSEYRNYFNAFGIFVASAQSGSDHPLSGDVRDTYFNSTFDSFDISQFVTIPPNRWTSSFTHQTYGDTNAANGQGKVAALLQSLMPEHDLVLMLVNDGEYGGSGETGNDAVGTMISSLNVFSSEIIVHESGHALGGLTDEYTDDFGFAVSEKPNATAMTSSNLIKWRDWIPSGTLIPTPDVSSNETRIGLFQGAQYHMTGWYRPKHDCKMRTISPGTPVPFCEVCSEQLVRSIYSHVRPIDSHLPSASSVAIYSTQAVNFSVSLMQPTTHNLSVQWLTNNVLVPGATNASFDLAPQSLGNGSHSLKAVVVDSTPLVRTDTANLLKQTNAWNLTVSLNELSLVAARYLAGNKFRFTITGAAPEGFVIQFSTNLSNWLPISTNVLSGGKFDYTNMGLAGSQRFYRAISPP